MTAPLPIKRSATGVSVTCPNDHYKGSDRVTVGVVRLRTLTAQCPYVPSIT